MSNDAKLEAMRAMVAATKRDYATAIDAYAHSLALDPDYLTARIGLFDSYKSAGRTDEAAAMVDELLRRAPREGGVLQAVADLRERQGRFAEALELMRSPYVNLSPSANAYPFYLHLLVAAGHWEEAAIEAGCAFKTETLWTADALVARILTLLHFHEYEQARAALAQLDLGSFGALVAEWAEGFARSGVLAPLRQLLDEAAAAMGDEPRLRAFAAYFGKS